MNEGLLHPEVNLIRPEVNPQSERNILGMYDAHIQTATDEVQRCEQSLDKAKRNLENLKAKKETEELRHLLKTTREELRTAKETTDRLALELREAMDEIARLRVRALGSNI